MAVVMVLIKSLSGLGGAAYIAAVLVVMKVSLYQTHPRRGGPPFPYGIAYRMD